MRTSEKNGQDSLLEVAHFGTKLLEVYGNRSVDFETPVVLSVLLHLEQVLDKGRVVVDTEDQQIKSEINKGMDEIRSGIVTFMQRIGEAETRSLLLSMGESFKSNFVGAAFSE